jgi:hypothetical protein
MQSKISATIATYYIPLWLMLVIMPVVWTMALTDGQPGLIAIVWFIAAFMLPAIGLVIFGKRLPTCA